MDAFDFDEDEPEDRQHRPFTRDELLVLAGITLVAALLRLYRLAEWAFWVDEAHTYRDVVVPAESFWSSNVSMYPLSYLLLRFATDVLPGNEEGWLRLPFVFFGIISVPALGLVGRGLVGPRPALVAAALLAVTPWHIYWSQNARSYALVLFFVLLAAGSAFAANRRRSIPLWIATVLLTIVAGLCHPSAYILIGAFLVTAFLSMELTSRPRMAKWFPIAVLVGLAFLVLVAQPLLEGHLRTKRAFSLGHLVQTLVFFVRPTLIVAAIGGALWLFDRGDEAGKALVSWCVVPLLVLGVLASTTVKVTAQYAFYTLPAFILLAATILVALARLVESSGFRGLLLRSVPIGILLLDLGGQSFLYFQKAHGERPRWREAAFWIQARTSGGYRVLTTNQPSMRYYLDPDEFLDEQGSPYVEVVGLTDFGFHKAGGAEPYIVAQIESARSERIDLFVVVSEPELYEIDRNKVFDSYVRTRFHQVLRLPNWTGPKDMTVMVYRLPPPAR